MPIPIDDRLLSLSDKKGRKCAEIANLTDK